MVEDKHNYNLTAVFEAIERLFPSGEQTQLRSVDQGSAYALLTVKGMVDFTFISSF